MDAQHNTMIEPVSFLPERVFFEVDPSVTVARPVLSLTLYLEDGRAWAMDHAKALFETFLELIDPSQLNVFTTSSVPSWFDVTSSGLGELAAHLTAGVSSSRLRHLFRFQIADDPWAPSLGFVYREIDPTVRTDQTGYVQILLPVTTNSDVLLGLAIEVAQTYPIVAGIGGYAASWNERMPRNAFVPVYRWCRRCLGLDVQHPESMSFAVSQGLPGASWLTLIGTEAQHRWGVDVEGLAATPWSHDIATMPLSTACLVKAGQRPEPGDANNLDYPGALAEVSAALEPYFIAEPPALPGKFGEEELTDAWFRRFSFPEVWS